jgi:pseudaminic acid synthase
MSLTASEAIAGETEVPGEVIGIGQRCIGPGHPPFVIAEMSGNHRGNLQSALAIVRAAAESGAHAIKLQTFTPATLTIDSHRPEFFIDDPGSLWHGRRLWELYDEAHTPWEWHEPIFEAARACGLACVSTAFDETSLEFLVRLGIDAVKIASFELVHLPLIAAVAQSGKPVLLSTGMASADELDEAVSALRANGCREFVLLKCTSAYPSEEPDANLATMRDMSSRYSCMVGLSDHTLRPYVAYAAVALGAAVVEKHMTLSRAEGGVDSAFSLEPAELRELVEGTKLVWLSVGGVRYAPLPSEETSRRERPSIYVVRAMKKGESFTPENVRVIRPGDGLAPRHYEAIIGKPAARDIHAEVPLSWDLIGA